jgi:hypothetical protein
MDGDRMNGTGAPISALVDLDDSPFEAGEIEGIPFAKDSVEAKAIRGVLEQYRAARARVGPGEFAHTDDSPFALPPRD